jgi:hypothetical protein
VRSVSKSKPAKSAPAKSRKPGMTGDALERLIAERFDVRPIQVTVCGNAPDWTVSLIANRLGNAERHAAFSSLVGAAPLRCESMKEQPNLNTGEPWSEMADVDLRWNVKWKEPVDRIAEFLCRTETEVRNRARELGLGELAKVRGDRRRTLIRGTRRPRAQR